MGFLRKVGRKIKRGAKKLLGGKFGKILGGIGLTMMFFGGANALFGNQKWFQGLKTNLNKVNPFAKGDVTGAVESATQAIDPTSVVESTTKALDPTTAVESVAKVVDPTKAVSSTPSLELTTEPLTLTSNKEMLAEGAKEAVSLSKQAQLDATNYSSEYLTDTAFDELATIGQKVKKVGVETKDFLMPDTSSFKEFAGDVSKSVVGAVAVNAVMGEDDEQTAGFGRMPSVGSMEAPQSSYLAEVKAQVPNLQATNFNQLNQSLFYGTLSPQYLMGQMG